MHPSVSSQLLHSKSIGTPASVKRIYIFTMADHLDTPVFSLSNQTVGLSNVEDSLSSISSNIDMENSRRIFWAVNFFIFFLIILSAVSCCVVSKYFLNGADHRAASDQYYQARLRRRQARERARNEEPLDKRQASLHASFARNNAQMVSYILC